MTSAAVLADGNELRVEDLPESVRGEAASSTAQAPAPSSTDLPLDEAVRAYEKARVEEALVASGGNQTQAAKLLGIPRKTLVSKLKALGIKREE